MSEKKCRCLLWVNGTIERLPDQLPIKTRVWDIGQKKVRDWEAVGMVFVTGEGSVGAIY